MSKAEELLNTLSEDNVMALTAESSTEPHIVIGSDRHIAVPSQLKRIAVQFDHNFETVTFDCPRYWDGHDLSAMDIYIICKVPDGAFIDRLLRTLQSMVPTTLLCILTGQSPMISRRLVENSRLTCASKTLTRTEQISRIGIQTLTKTCIFPKVWKLINDGGV